MQAPPLSLVFPTNGFPSLLALQTTLEAWHLKGCTPSINSSAHSIVATRLGHIGRCSTYSVAASVPSSIYTYGTTVASAAVVGVQPEYIGYVSASLPSAVKVDRSWPFLAAYVVCFYDWIISLDQEVAFIYPAPWNVVKWAYLFCRYYPLVIAPFHFWGLLGDHEQHVCEANYRVLFASTMPTMLSAQLSLLFLVVKRTSCFAISDQQTFGLAPVAGAAPVVPMPFAYHLGVRLGLWRDTRSLVRFPQHVRGVSGILVYVIMTGLNTLTIGTFFSSRLLHAAKGIGPWFAYILPSALSCRLVLMLRRKASPTETELRKRYSHMVNEALEMIAIELHPEETSEGFTPSTSTTSTDTQA
ncbi:hypothetical protein BJY52DRAFT_1402348 [Lactarius psammicola]|nr:hypothetical protein BJY52DRAFT_1402348 [Lactarius psammicola]